MGSAYPLHMLDRSAVTPLVRRAMQSSTVEVYDWSVYPIHSGDGEGLGVYRFVGTGKDRGQPVGWSLILKAFGSPAEGGEEGDWNYWKREAMAYRSGLLDDLPGSMAAPRCLGVEELADGIVRLWLEDVAPANDELWPLDRYALAARHLGQFNGAYLVEHSLPDAPWLSTNWLRGWVGANEAAVGHLERMLDHPLVRQVYPEGVATSFLRLWTERELFLDQLDRLPHTFCHLDAFRRNLLDRRLSDGSEQTLALDWAFVGKGAVGEELGPLIQASIEFFEAEGIAAQELEEAAFYGYLEGLTDAGWRGDPRVVRFGYAASTALRYGVGTVRLVLPILLDERLHARVEQLLDRPIEQVFEKWAEGTISLVPLSDEAHQLANVLHSQG
jgi:hypothetical protein